MKTNRNKLKVEFIEYISGYHIQYNKLTIIENWKHDIFPNKDDMIYYNGKCYEVILRIFLEPDHIQLILKNKF